MKYHLTAIYDIHELKKLCESYTELTGVATAIADTEGKIHVETGWQTICKQFHRIHAETEIRCKKSDTMLAGQIKSGQKYNLHKCKNGLTDVALPIYVNN